MEKKKQTMAGTVSRTRNVEWTKIKAAADFGSLPSTDTRYWCPLRWYSQLLLLFHPSLGCLFFLLVWVFQSHSCGSPHLIVTLLLVWDAEEDKKASEIRTLLSVKQLIFEQATRNLGQRSLENQRSKSHQNIVQIKWSVPWPMINIYRKCQSFIAFFGIKI